MVTAVAGDQDLIITEKNVGLPEITVEFRRSSHLLVAVL